VTPCRQIVRTAAEHYGSGVRVLAVVPAFRAARTVASVVEGLRAGLGAGAGPVIVVDDGSDDDTAREAERAGALVLRHPRNRGKGAALRTGFARALLEGADAVVSVDADAQHPPEEAVRVARHPAPPEALVLGVRDLRRDGAPRANRFSNAVSNLFLSLFGGQKLADTQCGLRRYPLGAVLGELASTANGYAYEADVLLRAARRGTVIEELPIRVVYPKAGERVTHFHSVRDPARIAVRVLLTTLVVQRKDPLRRALGWVLRTLGALLVLLFVLHALVDHLAHVEPVAVTRPHLTVVSAAPGVRRFGDSWVVERGALLEVGLEGTPEAIGFAHSALLRREMIENEGILLARFQEAVPAWLTRTLLLDLARFRYRTLERGMTEDRRTEIAAGAAGFEPDPYTDFLPTYPRFLYLNALYDMALSFEHSPLVGCTTIGFHGAARPGGGVLLARAFDMEVDAVFDRKKALFLVSSAGAIPFASVAWPGLVGVVSGMNAEGLAVVVHGARAGEPRTEGEPVVHALRRVLERARTVPEAVRLLAERPPLVSHLLVLADAHGEVAAVERVPGSAPVVRPLPERGAVTNHFEGGAAGDAKNLRVLRETSTRARRERADELLSRLSGPVGPDLALGVLRDRTGVGDVPLPLGDRRAIDALIATHGVLFDTASRTLWVSEAPHLLGRFVAFDLRRMLDPAYAPEASPLPALPADPLAARVPLR
jgi:isopenicillin-N N-acyltransferase like protein